MVQLTRDCASRLIMQEMGDIVPALPAMVESITVGPVVVLELFGQNAIRKLSDVVGENFRYNLLVDGEIEINFLLANRS